MGRRAAGGPLGNPPGGFVADRLHATPEAIVEHHQRGPSVQGIAVNAGARVPYRQIGDAPRCAVLLGSVSALSQSFYVVRSLRVSRPERGEWGPRQFMETCVDPIQHGEDLVENVCDGRYRDSVALQVL